MRVRQPKLTVDIDGCAEEKKPSPRSAWNRNAYDEDDVMKVLSFVPNSWRSPSFNVLWIPMSKRRDTRWDLP